MMYVPLLLFLLLLLLNDDCIILGNCDNNLNDDDDSHNPNVVLLSENTNITILGLGSMGMSIVKCLVSSTQTTTTPITVHAWNRGEKKREHLKSLSLNNVHVHDNMNDAIQSSNIILTMIDDWNGTSIMMYESIINNNNPHIWSSSSSLDHNMNHNKKTLILFSTYTPHDIQRFHNMVSQYVNVWGGAIIGVPQTICTPNAFVLSSSSSNIDDDSVENDISNSTIMIDHHQIIKNIILNKLGTYIHFNNNIGLASLANIGLIQTITFGIVGHELIQLVFKQYNNTSTTDSSNMIINNDFIEIYNNLMIQIVPKYMTMLLPLVSKGITYVPIQTFYNVMKMHYIFMMELNINIHNTYLHGYIESLHKQIITHSNNNNNEKMGPANWIQSATIQNLDNNNDVNNDEL